MDLSKNLDFLLNADTLNVCLTVRFSVFPPICERQAKTELDGMYLALLVHMLFVEGLILRVLSTGLLRVGFQRSIIVALR